MSGGESREKILESLVQTLGVAYECTCSYWGV